ncbi:MAG: LCP family protein [bacterium]
MEEEELQSAPPKIDNITIKEEDLKSPRSKFWQIVRKSSLVFFVLVGISLIAFSFKIISVGKDVFVDWGNEGFFKQISHLVTANDRLLQGEDMGAVNFLLMGIGGEGHDGAYLTDTIIVASYNVEQNKIALISLPRDLWVEVDGYGGSRINSVYIHGEQNNANGAELLGAVAEAITGLPINYYGQIDFSGFEEIIDTLGGVDIEVKNSFYDPMYPTENYGYQNITFNKGWQKMDGATALKYARSRHGIVQDGSGSEGTDFARSARQQQIIMAIKEKVLSASTFLNPLKINSILDALGNHMETNLEPWEMLRLADLGKNISKDSFSSHVIDNASTGLLQSTISPLGAYILQPTAGDYFEIKDYVSNIFNNEIASEEEMAEQAIIEIQNGTYIPGMAASAESALEQRDYNVNLIRNAEEQTYDHTVIYDYTSGNAPKTISYLQDYFNMAEVITSENNSNQELINPTSYEFAVTEIDKTLNQFDTATIVVVLGQDFNTNQN